MSKKYNLLGEVFGELTVIGQERVNNILKWKCACSCGNNNYYVVTNSLISGKTTRCSKCGNRIAHEKHRTSKIGQKFGMLTIVDEIYNSPEYNQNKVYICNCDCGKKNIVKSEGYKWSEESSCGCKSKENFCKKRAKDITGNKIGRLTVIETLWDETPTKVKCQCECGNIVILRKHDVQNKHTLSCGCLQKEMASKAVTIDFSGYISDSGITIVSPYKKNEKGQWLWKCKCGFCNNYFYELPARVKNNHVKSCGCINKSILEEITESVLKENNFKYIPQYTYEDCKNKYVLRFDFALVDEKNHPYQLIEVDGQQHYYPVELFGGKEGFEETIKRDIIKNEYCKQKNIPLLRLPYYLSRQEIIKKILNIKKP